MEDIERRELIAQHLARTNRDLMIVGVLNSIVCLLVVASCVLIILSYNDE